ncbi:MAG TPA: VOC family protein [Chitinophagales bacterium]|nr:VOC family protein [Chitinophagales bacterium]HRG28005.1 VOC family protein [Chitinophagales bacterium]HRG85278.1 VOC family protein [Chitinophagales bacterium]HRH52316.1 VOC family protein [Chitinophagales bacterium]
MTNAAFHRQIPVLPVADLKATIKYYKSKLGFSDEWFWEDTDAGCGRNELFMLFNLNPELLQAIQSAAAPFEIIWIVEQVDVIYNEYAQKELAIISEPENKPWGMREFTIKDINGYTIRIAEPIENE